MVDVFCGYKPGGDEGAEDGDGCEERKKEEGDENEGDVLEYGVGGERRGWRHCILDGGKC